MIRLTLNPELQNCAGTNKFIFQTKIIFNMTVPRLFDFDIEKYKPEPEPEIEKYLLTGWNVHELMQHHPVWFEDVSIQFPVKVQSTGERDDYGLHIVNVNGEEYSLKWFNYSVAKPEKYRLGGLVNTGLLLRYQIDGKPFQFPMDVQTTGEVADDGHTPIIQIGNNPNNTFALSHFYYTKIN